MLSNQASRPSFYRSKARRNGANIWEEDFKLFFLSFVWDGEISGTSSGCEAKEIIVIKGDRVVVGEGVFSCVF